MKLLLPVLMTTIILSAFTVTVAYANYLDIQTSDTPVFTWLSVTGFDITDTKEDVDKLPFDKLLEKGDHWKQKYQNGEFDKIDKAIRAYVNDTHPDNRWNAETKKNEIKIYNFDAIADKKNAGLHAFLANINEQKMSGTYEPTDAERLFYEWASKKITNPIMPEINPKLVKDVIEAYNVNINHGHVPFDLISSNAEFWSKVTIDTMCELYAECESDATVENPNSPDCAIIPCADAYHQSAYHYVQITVEPYSCYEGTGCMYTIYTTGTGALTIAAEGRKHTNSPWLKYTVGLASKSNVYLTATGTLSVGWFKEHIDPVTGISSVFASNMEYVDGVICGSSHCGTYRLTVTANSYIMH